MAGPPPVRPFTLIRANEYLVKPPRERDKFECECVLDRAHPEDACGETCLNRMMRIECSPSRYMCIS